MSNVTSDRERQRVEHLVLGRPRPRSTASKSAKRRKVAKPIPLVPGIEERVAMRERWAHKNNGTPRNP